MEFVLQRYVYIIRRNSLRYGKADHYFRMKYIYKYIHRKRNNDRLKRERERKKIESKKLFK